MSVISRVMNNKQTATTSNRREPSEFDGMWINVGIYLKDPDGGEDKFIRLPRGIAISDLEPKKVYANMTPEFAAQVQIENQMLAEIKQAALGLKEGESLKTDAISVELYRRNEEVDLTTSNSETQTLGLFG